MDILRQCALEFDKISNYNYKFTAGKSGKTFQINLSCLQEDFTHIVGLDHLTDLRDFNTHKLSVKSSLFEKILIGEITYDDILSSRFLDMPFRGTYNSNTNKEYTLSERIQRLLSIENLLDTAYKGKIYKWNNRYACIVKPNGNSRRVSIAADYLLVIPSPENKNENIYLFSYIVESRKKDNFVKLNIFYAFADCVDLTQGQERPMTILKETKYNIKTKDEQILYIHPRYNN